MRKTFLLLGLVPCLGAFGWACASPTAITEPPPDSGASDAAMIFNDGATQNDAGCTPAEVLVVIDRSESMASQPDGTYPPDTASGLESTKWYQAIEALYNVSAPPMDNGIAFGVELFPLDPQAMDGGYEDAGYCTTLEQIVQSSQIGLGPGGGKDSGLPRNTQCEPSQLLVAPALLNSQAIVNAVDPLTTHLCYSTPIGAALNDAEQRLSSDTFQGDKYVVLITDGQETCKGDTLGAAQKLAAENIKTFVVGFGAAGSNGVDTYALNNIACAGGTATDFSTSCTLQGGGYISIATNPVYFVAQDGASLTKALHAITGGVYCDPVK